MVLSSGKDEEFLAPVPRSWQGFLPLGQALLPADDTPSETREGGTNAAVALLPGAEPRPTIATCRRRWWRATALRDGFLR
jgi:hypothetical protein